eukprot:TRINITY_DN5160_c0_g1_i12.p1 TRINITY_DN5160_c0_g1~~TRINITY_DN5160_c0_g1_i12.p1  ORF type:complete len:620 (-),score=128.68 TRINITY_DN5160_c0_g1_i12:52-1911(-)
MASGGEPSRIRRLLSTFILRRPPRQALVARGILHEEQAIVVPRRRTFIGRLQDIRREKNRANSQGSIMIRKTKLGESPPPSRPEGTSPGSSSPSPPPSQSFNAQWRIGTRQTGMRPNMMIGHVGSASSPNLLENIRIPSPLGSAPPSVSAPHIAIAPSDVALASGPPVRIPPRPPPSRPLSPGPKSEPIPIEPTSAPSSPSSSETYSSSIPSSPSSTPTSPTLPRSPARPLPPRPGASSPPPIRPSPPSSPRPTLPSRPLPPSPLNRSTSFAGTNTIRPPTDISFNPSLPAPPAPRAPPPPPPPPPPTAPALKTPHPPTHPNPRKIRPPSKQIEMLTPPQFKQQAAPETAMQPTTNITIPITKIHPTATSPPPEVSMSTSPPLPRGTPPMRIRSPSLASAPTTDYMKLDDLPTGGPIALQIADTITVSRVRSPSSARKYQPPKPAPPAPPPPPTPTHTFLDMDYVPQQIINQPNPSTTVGAVKLKSTARLSLGFSQMETPSPPPPDEEAPPSPPSPSPSPPPLSLPLPPLPEVLEFPASPPDVVSIMPMGDFVSSPVSDQDQAASGDTYAPYASPGDPDPPEEDPEPTPPPHPSQLSTSADNTLSQFDEILFNINSSFS